MENVVCDGVASGLLIRGLPELAIKGIHLENVMLKADKGAEISEASNITLKNINILSKDTKPVIVINNGDHIDLDGIKYPNNADLLFEISGAKSQQINISNTDTSKSKNKIAFKAGADGKAVTIK